MQFANVYVCLFVSDILKFFLIQKFNFQPSPIFTIYVAEYL